MAGNGVRCLCSRHINAWCSHCGLSRRGDGNGSGGANGDDGGGADGVHGGRGDCDVNGSSSGRGVNEGGDDGDVDGGILVVKVLIVNQSYVYSCPCIHV